MGIYQHSQWNLNGARQNDYITCVSVSKAKRLNSDQLQKQEVFWFGKQPLLTSQSIFGREGVQCTHTTDGLNMCSAISTL